MSDLRLCRSQCGSPGNLIYVVRIIQNAAADRPRRIPRFMRKDHHPITAHLFREAYSDMVALMTARYGTVWLDDIEDSIQDGLLKAMQTWGYRGVPDNPKAWLFAVVRNGLVDRMRKSQRFSDQSVPDTGGFQEAFPDARMLADTRLRMVFACCHPDLKTEQQLLLALKLVAGFSNAEVARALFKKEGTVARAYTRSKEKLKAVLDTLEQTHVLALKSRFSVVIRVLYLIFNEGYKPTSGDRVLKHDMCREAIRMALSLRENPVFRHPDLDGLLALMCFHSARFQARMDEEGGIVDLEHQDRGLYDRELIRIGERYLREAQQSEFEPSRYLLEAAVSYLHCQAAAFRDTPWEAILSLYDSQLRRAYSPKLAVNRLVALGFVQGADAALDNLEKLGRRFPELSLDPLFHAVRGMFLTREGKHPKAAEAYRKAASLTPNPIEKAHFLRKAEKVN